MKLTVHEATDKLIAFARELESTNMANSLAQILSAYVYGGSPIQVEYSKVYIDGEVKDFTQPKQHTVHVVVNQPQAEPCAYDKGMGMGSGY